MKKFFLLSFAVLLLCCWSVALGTQANTSNIEIAKVKAEQPQIQKAVPSYGLTTNVEPSVVKDKGIAVPVNPQIILQGGDNMGTATVISSLPYSDAGTTSGYAHDFTFSSTCTYGNAAPDVYYVYTAPADGEINVSLCGSLFDTVLGILSGDGTIELACNDDYCSLQSQISGFAVAASTTYYIVVGGYYTNSGSYTLSVTENVPCVVTCPVPNTPENEPTCYDQYVDVTNGGCNSNPHVFGSILDAETICGTSGTFAYDSSDGYTYNFRDTDWFTFTTTERKTVTLTGVAEFPLLLFLISPPCPGTIIVSGTALPCSTGTASAVLDAGTYYAWVGPSVFSGVTCGAPYYATLHLTDPPPPPTPDLVVNGEGTFTGNSCDGIDHCNLRAGQENIIQLNLPTAGGWTFSFINSPTGWDAVAYLGSAICVGDLGYGDDFGGTMYPQISATLAAGTYYLDLEGYMAGYCGDWQLDVTFVPPPEPDFEVTAPGTWTGNTCDGIDHCILRAGQEHIYEITLLEDGLYTFSLTNSPTGWDAVAYLGSSLCTGDLGYGDDFGGTMYPSITTNLTAGVVYLDIEAYSSGFCGDYQLDITFTPPVVLSCPPNGIPEGEPDCGPGYVDTFNGGCNSSPYVFSPIASGQWICGVGGTWGGSRDTDWYRTVVDQAGDIVFKGVAEFPLQLLIFNAGTENCSDLIQLAYGTANPGDTLMLSATVEPGIYWFWAGPSLFDSWNCPLDYLINFELQTGNPAFSADHDQVIGQAPAGNIDTEIINVSNVGTRNLNFTVSTIQNELLSIGPRPAQQTGSTDNGMVSAKLHSSKPYTPDPRVILQGGDAIADATPINSLPYNDAGTTSGYVDDYVGSCNFAGAPDVVYSYTPAADIALDISLCNTAVYWDAVMYVFENNSTTEIACDDDGCGTFAGVSKLVNVALTAGNTYYIVIDGYDVGFGDYVIDVTENIPCVVTCPEPNTPEGEPDCYDGYIDATNGGCNATPHTFGTILPGETVCGTTGVYNSAGSRDTDWYLFNLTGPAVVTVSGEAETGIIMGLIIPRSQDPCDNTGYIDYYFIAGPCTPSQVSVNLDGSVPYILFVSTDSWNPNYVCGSKYYVTLDVQPLWLYTDVTSGTIPPGGAMPVTVSMNAGSLSNGTYTGSVIFDTNEPELTIHDIPVEFTVGGVGCNYIKGDINNNGAANGIDVVFGVVYFKGGAVPPINCAGPCPQPSPFYAAGDVNGNCGFNGIDITFFVNYLKGIYPALLYCPTCPPTNPLTPGVVNPTLQPTKISIGANQQ